MNTYTLSTGLPSAAAPRGPSGIGWAQMNAMKRDYLGTLRGWQQRYGDVVAQRMMIYRDYSFFHPDHIRELLVASHEQLIRWERGPEVFASMHGQSVLVVEGAAWKRQRQMLQPGFSPKRVETFVPLMADATLQALRTWRELDDFGFEAAMTSLTMDVILRSLCSRSGDAQSQAAAHAVHVLGEEGMKEFFWPVSAPLWAPWKSAKRRAIATLNGVIWGALNERLSPQGQDLAPKDDLLAMLMGLRDEHGQPLSPQALRDECTTIFLAGHETTAAALTWWGWCMAAHPEAQARAAEEVRSVLGDRPPTAADLPRLPWLALCFKEVLRLYPPAPALLTRRTIAPVHLAGLDIPVGATLRLTPAITQRDPRWFEEPEAFRPERFDPSSGHPEIPRGAWLPFGAGPRVCLGSHFALTEMSLIGAMILQRHAIEPVPGLPAPEPLLSITYRPSQPLRLRLRRR